MGYLDSVTKMRAFGDSRYPVRAVRAQGLTEKTEKPDWTWQHGLDWLEDYERHDRGGYKDEG
jgi:hypothetical protein